MAHPNVPKFGNWDGEDNVPYTVYFEKARKNKGVKMINPNDPAENPEMFQNSDPLPPAPPSNSRTRPEEPIGKGSVRLTTVSREGNEVRQFSNSPARSENMGQTIADESNYGGLGQKKTGRAARPSAGFDQSFDRSPLHPQPQAKVTGRGNRPSAVEENKSHDSSHGIPGRYRPKQVARDSSPDNGATVPRFGEWDEYNPQSAENFTDIFNKVREERNTGATNMSGTPKHPSYDPRRPSHVKPKKFCCCPWW